MPGNEEEKEEEEEGGTRRVLRLGAHGTNSTQVWLCPACQVLSVRGTGAGSEQGREIVGCRPKEGKKCQEQEDDLDPWRRTQHVLFKP